jgi:putative phosphoribosyl transferase
MSGATGLTLDYAVQVPAGATALNGDLTMPTGSHGLVIFAHGSGSSRFSPRNRFVAEVLQEGGLATLLLDLLTEREESQDVHTREHRFDIDLLAYRVAAAVEWCAREARTAQLPIGLFGASTGAAAALVAAAERREVQAVVSRGGRPDLAGGALGAVQAPTLLIVGADDPVVLRLNRMAQEQMSTTTSLQVIPGASHLFEESDTLARAAMAARSWFLRWLPGTKSTRGDLAAAPGLLQ